MQQTADIAGDDSRRWFRNGYLKKKTEGLILAAQEQGLRTNSIKHSIDLYTVRLQRHHCVDCVGILLKL